MTSIVYYLVLELSCFFKWSCHFTIDFPYLEVLISEAFVVFVMDLLHPSVGSRSLNDDIILTVVNQNGKVFCQKIFDSCNLGFHEIFKQTFIDFITLTSVFNIIIKLEKFLDIRVPEVLFEKRSCIIIYLLG